jgi:hypothetical protein
MAAMVDVRVMFVVVRTARLWTMEDRPSTKQTWAEAKEMRCSCTAWRRCPRDSHPQQSGTDLTAFVQSFVHSVVSLPISL